MFNFCTQNEALFRQSLRNAAIDYSQFFAQMQIINRKSAAFVLATTHMFWFFELSLMENDVPYFFFPHYWHTCSICPRKHDFEKGFSPKRIHSMPCLKFIFCCVSNVFKRVGMVAAHLGTAQFGGVHRKHLHALFRNLLAIL